MNELGLVMNIRDLGVTEEMIEGLAMLGQSALCGLAFSFLWKAVAWEEINFKAFP